MIISIHALREEGDLRRPCSHAGKAHFYPRPPRGGRRWPTWCASISTSFLSTPSARRATVALLFRHFGGWKFLSTPSARRATFGREWQAAPVEISIHALREEGDIWARMASRARGNFYPRPPRGGRPKLSKNPKSAGQYFYPRPPRGGRRAAYTCALRPQPISIHALREEGDKTRRVTWPEGLYISIHALREEGDHRQGRYKKAPAGFLSTPSARRATAKTETKSLFSNKLYNILHEFRRALIYNGSKNDPNHAKRLKNPVRRCRKNAEDSPFAPGRKTQNNSRPSCSKGG